MSLTRKQLSSMGLEADKIEEIITAHTETVSALKDKITEIESERDKLKEDAGKYQDTLKELNELKVQAAENADKDYAALKEEYEKYKADVAAEKSREEKKKLYTEIIKDAGITSEEGIKKVLKYTDLDSKELDDKGRIKDAKAEVKAIQEEWPELKVTQNTQGAPTATPPASTGGTLVQPSRAAQMARQYMSERYGTSVDNKED